MSSANAELVRRTVEAYLAGDEATLRELIHPESEVYGDPAIINAGTYYGFEGFQQWVRQWEEAWEDTTYEVLELTEVGDSVVVVPAHVTGRGVGSGVEIDSIFGWLYEFREGRMIRFHVYATVDDALEKARTLAGSP